MQVIDLRSTKSSKIPQTHGQFDTAGGKVIPFRRPGTQDERAQESLAYLALVSVLYTGSLGMGFCLLVKAISGLLAGAGILYGAQNLFGTVFPLLK